LERTDDRSTFQPAARPARFRNPFTHLENGPADRRRIECDHEIDESDDLAIDHRGIDIRDGVAAHLVKHLILGIGRMQRGSADFHQSEDIARHGLTDDGLEIAFLIIVFQINRSCAQGIGFQMRFVDILGQGFADVVPLSF
jgi:hypothetical protein